ncbi:MAG: glycosyltransferase family 2 protein, partial [Melioribacteraceae bacterium]
MPKVTLSMIVKNEEQYLRGCLESVKGIADEIVIVDTGSTDATLDIAKEFNAKIFHFEWIKDFSAARNFALSKSTGDWILYLDADERLEKKSKKELFRKIKGNNKLAINCIIKNLDDRKKAPTLMKYVRLFKNNKSISFTGKAHEQIEASLAKSGYKLVGSSVEITHLGYNVDKEKLKE